MSKALIIKGANFSANKITTITFNDAPCTGVSFDSDTFTASSLGAVSIPYTVTPAGTSEAVTWVSSDSSVLSVSNGVLTVNGIGTCELTVQCGNYSDTCTVTVNIVETPTYIIGIKKIDNTATTGESYDGIRYAGSARTGVACVGLVSDGNFDTAINYENAAFNPGDITALKIPENTAKIHIEAQGLYGSGNDFVYFVSMDDAFTYNDRIYAAILSTAELTPTMVNGVRKINEDVTVPTGASAYLLHLRPTTAVDSSITTEQALKEYAEGTMNISISYKAS